MDASNIIMGLVFLAGLLLFALWLLKTSLGRDALADSMPRRINMPLYLCFIPLLVWIGPVSLAIQIAEGLAADSQTWQGPFFANIIYCFGAILVMAIILFLVRASYARRLKGLGFSARSIHKDFFAAFAYLISVWPLMVVAMTLTTFFSRFIRGPEYQMPQHQQLKLIMAYPQWQLRILIFFVAAVMAPLLEEMLFRGLFQTVIRSYLESRNSVTHQNDMSRGSFSAGRYRAWIAIFISSGLFSVMHGDVPHWPALFVLGVCLGYSYEKSGSLFRPIFIHAFFNAITVLFVMLEV